MKKKKIGKSEKMLIKKIMFSEAPNYNFFLKIRDFYEKIVNFYL